MADGNAMASMNTQERQDEELDKFNEDDDGGAQTAKYNNNNNNKQNKQNNRTKSSKSSSSSSQQQQPGKIKHHGSLVSLSPLPEPTMKGQNEVSATGAGSNWGMDGHEATEEVINDGRRLRQYRMTIVGYSKVGKTALCAQFVENAFKNDYPRHKENLFKKKIDLPEMPTYRFMLDILDTQGAQEVKNREIVMEDRYRKRTNHIMLFVFSITSDKSFKFIEELLRIEYEADNEYFEKQGVIIAGNKSDLPEDREVETADARELARDYGAAYFETSAKNNVNVDKIFYEAVRKYHEKSGELEETMEPAKKLCPGCILM